MTMSAPYPSQGDRYRWMAPYKSIEKAFMEAPLEELGKGKPKTSAMAWNNESSLLGTAGADGIIVVWKWDNESTGKLKPYLNLKGHDTAVNSVTWNPHDKDLCASAATDGSIRIWDLRARRCVAQAESTNKDNLHISWGTDKPYIAVATRENHIVILDTRTNKTFRDSTLPEKPQVNQIQFRKNDELYTSLGYRGSLQRGVTAVLGVDDPDTLQWKKSAQMHAGLQSTLKFTSDMDHFITSGSDGIVNLCDSNKLIPLRSYDSSEETVWTADISHDGQFIAYCQINSSAQLIRTSDGGSLRSFPDTEDSQSISWAPTKPILAIAARDNALGRDDHSSSKGKIQLLRIPSNN